jgi:hypothetical protein
MKLTVPYSRMGGLDYPFVTVTVGDRLKTPALVDSGASFSVFKMDVAMELGVKIRSGQKMTIGSIKGGIPIYIHKLPVEIAGHRFRCKIGFSDGHVASINILGRDNFFREFIVVFDEKNRTVTLKR